MSHSHADRFFEVRINSVPPLLPLVSDLYLVVAGKPVLFRRKGDSLTAERVAQLTKHGARYFLIPRDQKTHFLQSLRAFLHDPKLDTASRSRFIKETAFVHMEALFSQQDIADAVSDARVLVEDMVSLVTSDVEAVSSLLRLSAHDYYTYNHCVDVAIYSVAIAKRIFGNDKEKLVAAGMGGLLHDLGKKRLDERVINKSSPLTPDEWEQIKRHPVYGFDALEVIPTVPDLARRAVKEHHENHDGTGYPLGLEGESIGELTRIVAIADVFDALTTERSYQKAVPSGQALDIMYGLQPGKFDPAIFRAFNKNFSPKSPLTMTAAFDPCQPDARKHLRET